MEEHDTVLLKFKEGPVQNYFDTFIENFGGSVTDGVYIVDKPGTFIKWTTYQILPEFEFILGSSMHNKTVAIDRAPDDNPDFFHIYIIKEGQVDQKYGDNRQFIEAGSSKGVFVYNGLFHINSTFLANISHVSINFKFSRKALHKLIPEATPIFNTLFSTNDPIAYHTQLNNEMETLVEDIIHFKQSEFGSKALTISRSLELFTLYLRSLKNDVDKEELNGLHTDDYKRLLKIKAKLLSSFDQKISIDNLANEYHISTSKLKRDFKTLFHTSIYKFYTHAKMDEAYRRLKTGKFSVMDVGYELGYQNLSKFSEMFKKVKGISPKEVTAV